MFDFDERPRRKFLNFLTGQINGLLTLELGSVPEKYRHSLVSGVCDYLTPLIEVINGLPVQWSGDPAEELRKKACELLAALMTGDESEAKHRKGDAGPVCQCEDLSEWFEVTFSVLLGLEPRFINELPPGEAERLKAAFFTFSLEVVGIAIRAKAIPPDSRLAKNLIGHALKFQPSEAIHE